MVTMSPENFENNLRLAISGEPGEISRLLPSTDSRIISALLDNPKLPAGSVLIILRYRRVNHDHIKRIAANIKWIKEYKVKLELVLNPVCPLTISLKLVKDLYQKDLAVISHQITLHPALRTAAENILKVRMESMLIGEKITLAKVSSLPILRILLLEKDPRIFTAALSNYRMTEIEVIKIASDRAVDPDLLGLIAEHSRWSLSQPVLRALGLNPAVSYAYKRMVFEKLHMPVLIQLVYAGNRDENDRKLARFVVRNRFRSMNNAELYQLALSHSKNLLRELLLSIDDPDIIEKIISNRRLQEEDIVSIVSRHPTKTMVAIVSRHPRFTGNQVLLDLLMDAGKIGDRADEQTIH